MTNRQSEEKWHIRMVRPGLPGIEHLPDLGLPDLARLPWLNRPIRPADIGAELRGAMLARENMLEDVNYQKVVPNRYLVEVSESNYANQFRPIEVNILQQWRERLLEELMTANDRQGRKEYRFGGRLRVEVRPASDLRDTEARVLCRIEADGGPAAARDAQPQPAPHITPPPAARPHPAPPMRTATSTSGEHPTTPAPPADDAAPSAAFLELLPGGQRWALYPGVTTIGRSEACQIYLAMPVVQEKRLVSGQHAYIVMERGACTLYDGAPDGRPSANGTFVNLRRVPPSGYRLQNGDAIVLAAADPLYPRSDTPGVVTFYFWTQRRG